MSSAFVCRRSPLLPGALLFIAICLNAGAQTKPEARTSKPAKPAPDTLVLVNGDTLTGQLQRAIGGSVLFHSDLLNLDIPVPFDKIRELHSSKKLVVLAAGQRITRRTPESDMAQGSVSIADKKVTVTQTNKPNREFPVSKVAAMLDDATFERGLRRTPSIWRAWNGNVNAGATIVRGTSDSTTYSGGFALVRAVPEASFLPAHDRTALGFSGSYGKITTRQATSVSTPNPPPLTAKSALYHAYAERDRYFSTQFYALGQTAFDHNYAQGLDLQQIYGGGIGWTAIKNPRQQLDVKATLQYERQSYMSTSSTPSQDLVGSTYTLAYVRHLPYKAVFNQQVLIVPAYNNPSALSISENDSLALPVYKRLSLTVSTLDSYLYDPPAANPPNQRNSFQFTTGLSYSLK